MISCNRNKLSVWLYSVCYNMFLSGKNFPWFKKIQSILIECGLNYVWIQQSVPSVKALKVSVERSCKDRFVQLWYGEVYNSKKCSNYRIFKSQFGFEEYLKKLPPVYSIPLTKFRCRNSRLPVELGIYKGIIHEERFCKYCNVLGDEFHYLFQCINFKKDREMLIDKIFFQKTLNF